MTSPISGFIDLLVIMNEINEINESNFGCGSRKDVNGIGRGSESEGYLKGEGLTWVICSHMVIISPSAHSCGPSRNG